MQRFYRGMLRHSKLILLAFILLTAASFLMKPLVQVNYDMNDYLPPESASTVALETMSAEFDGGIPNALVMLHDVSVAQALACKKQLQAVDGVTDVTWLDDAADVLQPLATLDADTVAAYYTDGNALLTVTIAEDKRVQAVNDIRAVIGDENAMTGSAVSTAIATASTVSEVQKIALLAVAIVFLILTLTTTSWIEPILVLVSLGVAILINSGTNLIFGEISFVTNAAGNVLQLAVSLDYSVFLIHRYTECLRETNDRQEAMVQALCKSTTSILSSGLTTVIGFLALCLMRFQIGPDLGLALAKGVAISLLTVFFFSPVLILKTSRLMEKTRHRPFMPSFRKLGKVILRLMIPLTLLFCIVVVPAYLASGANSYYYGSSHIFGTETQLGADTAEIEDSFGKRDTYVLLVPKGDFAQEAALSAELKTLPQVKSILSYVDNAGAVIPTAYVPSDTLSKLVSANYSRMVLSVKADYEGDATFALIGQVRAIAQRYYPDTWLLAGEGVSTCDLKETVTADMTSVNLVAIGAVFVILLLTMQSLTLPVILVAAIESAIWLNLSLPYLGGQPVFYIAYLIISSVQLGATVDYAILFTDRYREFRQHMCRRDAVVETVSGVTVSVLTSGLTLTTVGFLLGEISTHGLLSQLGYFIGKGTICSMVIVLFILPGLLYLLDGLVRRTTRHAGFLKEEKK